MAITLTISSGVLVVEDFAPWSPSIQNVTAGTSANPGIIARDSLWTRVQVSGAGFPNEYRVQPSSAFQTHDFLEIHVAPGSGGMAFQVSSGSETVEGLSAVNGFGPFRKTTSSTWRAFVS